MNDTIVKLFKEEKFQECLDSIGLSSEECKVDNYVHQLCMDNNIFVSTQLAQDWEVSDMETLTRNWTDGMKQALEIRRSLMYQQLGHLVPKDVALCVTHNALVWEVMKVDPKLKHTSSSHIVVKNIISTMSYAMGAFEDFQLRGPFCNIVEELVHLSQCIIPHLLKQPPEQCHLLVDMLALSFLLILDEFWEVLHEVSTLIDESLRSLDTLITAIPQIRVHISSCILDGMDNSLFKFGFLNLGEVFDGQYCKKNIGTSLDVLHFVGAIFCLRLEKYNDSERYLGGIKQSDTRFQFIFHYLKAFLELKRDNMEECLYHLSCVPTSSGNYFMHVRLNLLKGEALLLSGKAILALKALHEIQCTREEAQLPLAAYLTAKAYGALGEVDQQIEVLDSLVECLSLKSAMHPSLSSPLLGMEHRLLLAVHRQPELSYGEALYASAAARVQIQPKRASDQLLELLRVINLRMDCDIHKSVRKLITCNSITNLLHDTASALLQAGSASEAQLLCRAALKVHQDQLDLAMDQMTGLKSLKEDVVALILLAETQAIVHSSQVHNTMNTCTKLLQDFLETQKDDMNDYNEDNDLARKLLARVYLKKAELNIERNFSDDALACFQRALSFNQDDAEVLLKFATFLLDADQCDESSTIWSMYNIRKKEVLYEDITLKHIFGSKLSLSERQDTITRLKSLNER